MNTPTGSPTTLSSCPSYSSYYYNTMVPIFTEPKMYWSTTRHEIRRIGYNALLKRTPHDENHPHRHTLLIQHYMA